MGSFGRWIAVTAATVALLATQAAVAQDIQDKFADVNGIRMHYLVAGKGDPVILMHGYAQNSRMWLPTIRELAKTHLVVAPDLRGFGDTAKAKSGYDMSWRRSSGSRKRASPATTSD
jgi:alpha-beta hydrolase superfamily lysophospholipase